MIQPKQRRKELAYPYFFFDRFCRPRRALTAFFFVFFDVFGAFAATME
jgi:hypothetical protein